MRLPSLVAAFAFVAAAALLAPAVASVQPVLAQNTWRVPVPPLEILRGPQEDPTGQDPEGDSGDEPPPPPVIVRTETAITDSPPRIEKGQEFVVRGRVTRIPEGDGVPGSLVVLFLNETKEDPGFRVGSVRTAEDGTFRFAVQVPPPLPARPYQIVASALDNLRGQTLYLESWSDPPTVVHSQTGVNFHLPKEAAAGDTVVVEGWIRDVSGGPVERETVILLVNDEIVASALTDGSGFFRLEHVFHTRGDHEVTVRFPGTAYYGESQDTKTIRIGGVGHEISSAPSVFRNESARLAGRLEGDEGVLAGERVVVTVEGLLLGGRDRHEFTTDANGEWSAELPVPRDATPGRHVVVYEVPGLGLHDERALAVRAHTRVVLLEAPSAPDENRVLETLARLEDDLGQPIPHEKLTLRAADAVATARADENGTVALRAALPGGPHVAQVRFGGNEHYEGSGAQFRVDVPYTVLERARAWILPALAALLALGALAAALSPPGRRALRALVAAADPRAQVRLELDLPDVAADLPDVWGVGEPLRAVVRASTKDGAPLPGLPLALEGAGPSQAATRDAGRLETTVTFAEEGVADLAATFRGDRSRRPARARRPVRVVDYRRAIEEGFEEMRATLAARGVPATAATPPRELERAVRAAAPALSSQDLDAVLTLFEVSDYSERPIGRDDWIRFHRTRVALERALDEGAAEPAAARSAPGVTHAA